MQREGGGGGGSEGYKHMQRERWGDSEGYQHMQRERWWGGSEHEVGYISVHTERGVREDSGAET